jgi:hypothetical protein
MRFHGQNQYLTGIGRKSVNQIKYCLNRPPSPAERHFGEESSCKNAYRVICYCSTCSIRHKYGNRSSISRRLPAGSFSLLYFVLLTFFHALSIWMLHYYCFYGARRLSRCIWLLPIHRYQRPAHAKSPQRKEGF